MKMKNLILIILLLSLTCPLKISNAQTIGERRGIWYHALGDSEVLPNNYSLARIKLWNDFKLYSEKYDIHDVFILTKSFEDVIYNSNISGLTNRFNFDALGLACEIAQDFNISIHAWLELRTYNTSWQTYDIDGNNCSLGNFALPEYRQHNLDIVNEIIENYPVKGVQLDYIRYDGKQYSYDNYSITTFQSIYGFDPRTDPDNPLWLSWREQQITNMVNETYILVKSHNLTLDFSCAVWGWKNPDDVLQNWFNWTKIPILDFACPMNYETNNANFESNCQYILNNADPRTPILMGIGIWQIDGQTALEQINITRKYDFAGFVLYRDKWLLNIPSIPPRPEPQNSQTLWYHNPYIVIMVIFAIAIGLYFFKEVKL
jgi:hypothetical protein